MEIIDSHAHLTFDELQKDLDAVLQRSVAAGVSRWITIGTSSDQNKRIISIIEKYENIFGTIGIHPHYATEISNADIKLVKELSKNKKIVAIGEIGLDYYRNLAKPDDQKELFKKLLAISIENQLPVIIHCRDAFDETIEIIDEFKTNLKNVVFHCWGGSTEQTKLLLDSGFHISFTGVITFKKANSAQQAVKIVPLDRMMIETDCPFISPEPMRKQKINEPALLVHIAAKIAELKNMPLEIFAEQVTKTTKKFFNLP